MKKSLLVVSGVLVFGLGAFLGGLWLTSRTAAPKNQQPTRGTREQTGDEQVVKLPPGVGDPQTIRITDTYTESSIGPGYYSSMGDGYAIVLVARMLEIRESFGRVFIKAGGDRLDGSNSFEIEMRLLTTNTDEYVVTHQETDAVFAQVDEMITRRYNRQDLLALADKYQGQTIQLVLPFEDTSVMGGVDAGCNTNFKGFLDGEELLPNCQPTVASMIVIEGI